MDTRKSVQSRKTNETEIRVSLDLDGTARPDSQDARGGEEEGRRIQQERRPAAARDGEEESRETRSDEPADHLGGLEERVRGQERLRLHGARRQRGARGIEEDRHDGL